MAALSKVISRHLSIVIIFTLILSAISPISWTPAFAEENDSQQLLNKKAREWFVSYLETTDFVEPILFDMADVTGDGIDELLITTKSIHDIHKDVMIFHYNETILNEAADSWVEPESLGGGAEILLTSGSDNNTRADYITLNNSDILYSDFDKQGNSLPENVTDRISYIVSKSEYMSFEVLNIYSANKTNEYPFLVSFEKTDKYLYYFNKGMQEPQELSVGPSSIGYISSILSDNYAASVFAAITAEDIVYENTEHNRTLFLNGGMGEDEESTTTISISGRSSHAYGMNTEDSEAASKKELDKLTKKYSKAYDKYRKQVSKKIDETNASEGKTKISYIEQAKTLKNNGKLYINQLYEETNAEAELAAYETMVRILAEACKYENIDFSNVNLKDADSAILNKVYNYIVMNAGQGTMKLDSKVNGRKVKAEYNLLFGFGTITIVECKTNDAYVFSCSKSIQSAQQLVGAYFKSLTDLETKALDNAQYECIKATLGKGIAELIGSDFKDAVVRGIDGKLQSLGIGSLVGKNGIITNTYNYYTRIEKLSKNLSSANYSSIEELRKYMMDENASVVS